ncbi:unnamed protein product, partial [Tuber aestivum]
ILCSKLLVITVLSIWSTGKYSTVGTVTVNTHTYPKNARRRRRARALNRDNGIDGIYPKTRFSESLPPLAQKAVRVQYCTVFRSPPHNLEQKEQEQERGNAPRSPQPHPSGRNQQRENAQFRIT